MSPAPFHVLTPRHLRLPAPSRANQGADGKSAVKAPPLRQCRLDQAASPLADTPPTGNAVPPTCRGEELTAERAKQLLDYNPASGILRRRQESMRPGRYADTVKTVDKDGYLLVKLDGYCYRAHRVIFLMMTGRWPKPTCDHISRNTLDNRWSNLREATHAEQTANRVLPSQTGRAADA